MSAPAVSPTSLHGIGALRITGADGMSVTVSTSMGPRILALAGADGRNILAQLPEARISLPGLPEYRMLGGHRLWHTPEIPERTYRPDEEPVDVLTVPGGLDLMGADDPIQGIRKRLRVVLDGPIVRLEHELRNTADLPITTSAWAITQVPPAGEAWVPFAVGPIAGAYLPNRSIVLWPYSSLADARLTISDDLAIVRGIAGSEGRVKVGTQRSPGWIAWRDGSTLLVIEAAQEPGDYGDMGAGTQCYSCGDFVELETLGPIVTLSPGQTTVHRQAWRLVTVDPATPVREVIADLGLISH